jgi:hypothetical protein
MRCKNFSRGNYDTKNWASNLLINQSKSLSLRETQWLGSERLNMKNGLFRFYFVFILLSVGLFSCENRVISHERKAMDEKDQKEMKPNTQPKKPSRFYSQSSNLC